MSKVETTQEFFRLLGQSQLLAPRVLNSVREKAKTLSQEVLASPRKVAGTLVKSGLVTAWQARRLLTGKAAGFYVGRYKLLDLIGSGGMGRVYLAEHLRMHQLVAIKILRPIQGRPKHVEKEIVTRFAREAQAIAALSHPNIVQAFDFDDVDGLRYLVMEFVEGVDATTQLVKEGPLHWSQVADYICQAAAGLQHAHDAGLVHRDVKPANLLISKSGQVKIVDLGLVSSLPDATDDAMTVDEYKLGTVDFIAPEQAVSSHDVDARADIYSLGGSFYRLASGKLLFPGLNTTQKLLAQQMREPQPITELVPDLPEPLAAAVNRMLAKNRDDRFATAVEVIEAVKPFAKAVSPPYNAAIVPHTRDELEPFLRRGPAAFDTGAQSAAKVRSPGDSDYPIASPDNAPLPLSSPDLVAGDSVIIPIQAPTESGMTSLRLRQKNKQAKQKSTGLIIGGVVGVLAIGVIAVLASQIAEEPTDISAAPPKSAVADAVGSPETTAAKPVTDMPEAMRPQLVIAGVLPDAAEDQNDDGEVNGRDEYVRIGHAGTERVSLAGYELADNVGTRHIFPPNTVIEPGEAIMILSHELNLIGPRESNGIWNNDGDEIILDDALGNRVTRQQYFGSKKGVEIVFWKPTK